MGLFGPFPKSLTLFMTKIYYFCHSFDDELMNLNLYSAKTIEIYSKALYIKLKLLNKIKKIKLNIRTISTN